MKYHIWTIGCQMNTADSQRMASELERIGYRWTEQAEDADVVVLNTCVVRQQAEDKIYGRLGSLRPVKAARPDMVIGLMGCVVGQKPAPAMVRRFPHVDVFIPPSETRPLIDLLTARALDDAARGSEAEQLAARWSLQDGDAGAGADGPADDDAGAIRLPARERTALVSAHVPIIFGCNWVCTFCIIPSRRGRERSRPPEEIEAHARSLVAQGVREITLLGQIVDRYGYDHGVTDGLPRLLERLDAIDGLERIRFLTGHPKFMTDDLLDTVAALPKVMEHIEVPIQAGDDRVLERMKRGYTADDYRRLVGRIRERIPGVAVHTDIIVGFPGETDEQFQATYDILDELKLDKAHIAKFSSRPGTVAAKMMLDDVSPEEKERRRAALDGLQERIVGAMNAAHVGRTVEVLIEGRDRDRWRGRTRTNKLVYVDDRRPLLGRVIEARIEWAGPWSMIGRAIDAPAAPARELIALATA
ncbi:MAG: tRNA (N6-isopentenyl adenosine(37)-C2)-methylthiotransferase MiaB [Anaerolineae bacterium]